MDGRLALNGSLLDDLSLAGVCNVAYALVTEGLDQNQRREVDGEISRAGEQIWLPMRGRRRLAETWGRTPDDAAAQRAMEELMPGARKLRSVSAPKGGEAP